MMDKIELNIFVKKKKKKNRCVINKYTCSTE